MKKIIIFSVAIVVLVLFFGIYPFFNTGLSLTVTPENSLIVFDRQNYNDNINIKYPKGEYLINITHPGYENFKKIVFIKGYGITRIKVDLVRKELIKKIPYYPTNDSFWIVGDYINGEPTYEVHYFDEVEKNKATKWLEVNGVTEKKL